jgi:nitroreductase
MGAAKAEERVPSPTAPLYEVMATMRAMRRLKPDPVPRDLLMQLVEAATWAPSGANAQAYSWVIVSDRQQMRSLAELWARCHELYMASAGEIPVDTMDQAKTKRLHRAVAYQTDHFAETPALLVACYDLSGMRARGRSRWRSIARGLSRIGWREVLRAAPHVRRMADMSEAASVYPGVQNLLLAARALGLGASLTTWHLLLEPAFKERLDIPSHIRTFAVVPVGWPMGKFGPLARRPVDEVVHWDAWQSDTARPVNQRKRSGP